MILRTHGAPGVRPVRIFVLSLFVVLFAMLGAGGCAQKEGSKAPQQKGAAAVSDTSAYRDARAVADTTARAAAWEAFLKNYPESSFRPRVMASYCDLLMARDPARLNDFVTRTLTTEKDPDTRGQLHYAAYKYAQAHAADRVPAVVKAMRDDPQIQADACNMVSWDLVERNQLLDDAIALAALGATKATDDASKASIIDTEGWAYFVKGEYPKAIELLTQAVGLDKENSELLVHLAEACDKGGQPKEAMACYVKLLIPAEDPAIRERIETLSKSQGQSSAAVFKEVDQAREANAKPASDFTLKDYSGKDVAFAASTKGKVVLLNFWHPT